MSLAARASGLIARAAHDATPTEEARTAGFLLAKLIATHGLVLHEPGQCLSAGQPQRAPRHGTARPTSAPEPKAPISSGRWVTAQWASRCFGCDKRVQIGGRAWWIRTRGVMCRPCWEVSL